MRREEKEGRKNEVNRHHQNTRCVLTSSERSESLVKNRIGCLATLTPMAKVKIIAPEDIPFK